MMPASKNLQCTSKNKMPKQKASSLKTDLNLRTHKNVRDFRYLPLHMAVARNLAEEILMLKKHQNAKHSEQLTVLSQRFPLSFGFSVETRK